jgi:hypothetical protein
MTMAALSWTHDGHAVELRSRMSTSRGKPYYQVILDGRLVGKVFADDDPAFFAFAPEWLNNRIAGEQRGGFPTRNAAAEAMVAYALTPR